MQIKHRVSLNVDAPKQATLKRLGIAVGLGFEAFEVAEDQPEWASAEPLVAAWGAVDVVSTTFSAAEMKAATWLHPVPQWQMGYPQPEDDDEYRRVTYETADRCETCGAGLRQIAPFRMSGEPSWGNRQVGQLHWVRDAWFVRKDVYDDLLAPLGVQSREVLSVDGHDTLGTVVQLLPDLSVQASTLGGERCSSCGTTKHAPPARGFFPPVRGGEGAHVVQVSQWFGSGAAAYRPVLVSQDLYRQFMRAKTKGARFIPARGA